MDVSENSGTPKSSILIGFSIINHPFWDTPIFGNTHIYLLLPPFPSMASWIWYVTSSNLSRVKRQRWSKLRSRLPLWTERSCGVRKKWGRTRTLSLQVSATSSLYQSFCSVYQAQKPTTTTTTTTTTKTKKMWNYIFTEWVFFFFEGSVLKKIAWIGFIKWIKWKPYWPTYRISRDSITCQGRSPTSKKQPQLRAWGWMIIPPINGGYPYNGYINPETNIAHEDPSFPGKFPSKVWIFHGDLLVYRSAYQPLL